MHDKQANFFALFSAPKDNPTRTQRNLGALISGRIARFLCAYLVTWLSLTMASPASAIDMKVDRITINNPLGGSANWTEVTFQETFDSVPVVLVMPTDSNSDPATVRIRNVTTDGFEVGVVEPPGADGQTAAMDIDYFAAEIGTYTFPGGVRVQVGSYSTTTHQGRNVPGANWDDVNFSTTFSAAPAVIAQVQTINSQPTLSAGDIGLPFLEVTIRNVTTVDMDIALERAETTGGTQVAETIGFLAMVSGTEATISGETIQATLTPDNVSGWSNGCFVRNFSSAFGATPLVVATQNSRDGGDGGWVRRCSISATGVGLTIDEDQSNDTDRSHTTEEVGVLAISAAFHGTRNGNEMEAGSVSIGSTAAPTTWTSVSFPNLFSASPHIFALPTDEGPAPAALRVRNISTSGFDIAAFEPFGGTGSHGPMTIDYVAIIPGEHTLPNGDVFEVGEISTNLYQAGTGGSTGTVNINFNTSFGGPPAMLLQVESINNEPALDPIGISAPWMVTAVTALGAGSATVAIDRAESISGSLTLPETIAYFLSQDTANETLTATDGGTVDYETFITPDNIFGFDDGCFNNNFADSYASPHAIATQSTRDGNNGGWVRRCALSGTQIGLTIDEDQSNDSERTHTTEEASVFVFSRAFEANFNTIDHYAIFHGGSGVTCEAATVTIAAHDASELGVEAGGRTITVTATSTTPGWVASDVTWSLASGAGTFTIISPAVVEYTFDTGESSVELQLSNLSVADIDIDVVDNDPTLTDQDGVAEDPLLSFADTGFRFYNDADGDGNADATDPISPTFISGSVSGQFILRAVETNSGTGTCESRVSGSQNVRMAYECVDPTSCIRADDLEISNTPISENDLASVSAFDIVNLTFDSDGEAPFVVEYFDVGRIRLHAELTLPASGGSPAVTLTGSSDTTVVTPADIVITQVTDTAGTANPKTTTSGSGFVRADSPFTVVVQVRNSVGGLTPNYGNEIAGEGLVLSTDALIMPSAGDLPALIQADAFSATATAGEFENTTVRWPEVGTITMHTEILDGSYLDQGNVSGTLSANIGRFYPDHYALAGATLAEGCPGGGFTYMSDQLFSYTPADLNYSIEARSAGLARLENYDNNYPVGSFTFVAENSNDGNNLAGRISTPTGTWTDGLYSVTGIDNLGFARLLSAGNEQPDGPYFSIQLGIQAAASTDSTNFLSPAFDLNATSTTDCSLDSSCNAISLGSPIDLRFGRLSLQDAHGPESANLSVPFTTEYWAGATDQFVLNTSDSCTSLAMSDIAFDGSLLSVDASRTVTIGSGSSTGSFATFSPGVSMSLTNGDGALSFSAPGTGNTGSFDIDVNLTNYPWLRSDWNNDGDAANNTVVPTVTISFGRYRGHDRIIFWEEVLD